MSSSKFPYQVYVNGIGISAGKSEKEEMEFYAQQVLISAGKTGQPATFDEVRLYNGDHMMCSYSPPKRKYLVVGKLTSHEGTQAHIRIGGVMAGDEEHAQRLARDIFAKKSPKEVLVSIHIHEIDKLPDL